MNLANYWRIFRTKSHFHIIFLNHLKHNYFSSFPNSEKNGIAAKFLINFISEYSSVVDAFKSLFLMLSNEILNFAHQTNFSACIVKRKTPGCRRNGKVSSTKLQIVSIYVSLWLDDTTTNASEQQCRNTFGNSSHLDFHSKYFQWYLWNHRKFISECHRCYT